MGAAALGSVVGLAIGGAYLAGGMARDAVVHAQIQRLAGSASTGFSEVALDASAQADPGALAIARRHDPLANADLDPRQRRIAALVDRLQSRPSATPSGSRSGPQPLMRASFAGSSVNPGVARPFQLRGALDESRDLDCLAQAVYYEARGEAPSGQAAVAQVVLNRVRHPAFPKSVCAVVFQGAKGSGCQFSFACDGAAHHPIDSLAWRRAEKVAAAALDGQVMPTVGNATHFHVVGLNTAWGGQMLKVAQIGSHVFYRFGGHAGSERMFRAEPQPSDKSAEVKPVFASLGMAPQLPTAAQAQQAAGQVFSSAAGAVEHAAAAVENAAKAAVSPPEAQKSAPKPAAPAATNAPSGVEDAKPTPAAV